MEKNQELTLKTRSKDDLNKTVKKNTYKGLSFQKVWLFRSTVSEISFRQGL